MYKKLSLLFLLLFGFQSVAYAQLSIQSPIDRYIFSLDPGDHFETPINFRSAYKTDLDFDIYTVDGTKTKSGGFAAKLRDEEQKTFGKWVSLEQDLVTLGYQETKPVKLIFDIPENVTPGDYSGAIVASKILPDTNGDSADGEGVVGLKFQTRLAVPFYLSISGERLTKVDVGDMYFEEFSGHEFKAYLPVTNSGNTTVKFRLNSILKSLYGEDKVLPAIEVELFPNEDATIEIPLGNLGLFGSFTLNTSIAYSELNIVTNVETPVDKVEKNIQITIIPWLQIFLALGVIVLIIGIFVGKKAHFRSLVKNSMKYTVKDGDSVTDLAKSNNVNWKLITKINKLKPPYELKTGQQILIPKSKK